MKSIKLLTFLFQAELIINRPIYTSVAKTVKKL